MKALIYIMIAMSQNQKLEREVISTKGV
jgi:hypothetical protein